MSAILITGVYRFYKDIVAGDVYLCGLVSNDELLHPDVYFQPIQFAIMLMVHRRKPSSLSAEKKRGSGWPGLLVVRMFTPVAAFCIPW